MNISMQPEPAGLRKLGCLALMGYLAQLAMSCKLSLATKLQVPENSNRAAGSLHVCAGELNAADWMSLANISSQSSSVHRQRTSHTGLVILFEFTNWTDSQAPFTSLISSHLISSSKQGNHRQQTSLPVPHSDEFNHTNNADLVVWRTYSWQCHLANSFKHSVVPDSAHWSHGMKTCRHP